MHSRKPLVSLLLLLAVACTVYFVASGNSNLGSSGPVSPKQNWRVENKEQPAIKKPTEKPTEKHTENAQQVGELETAFMPKMANETLKAALGNSAWHLMHTVLARYPDEPTKQQKNTLKQYLYLFAQVYPCGDCARHFQKLLQKYPPQVGSRKTAAIWGCHIHNKVNEKLKKPEYDCTTILEDYDCGCGADEKAADFTLGNESIEHLREVKVDQKEQKQRGG